MLTLVGWCIVPQDAEFLVCLDSLLNIFKDGPFFTQHFWTLINSIARERKLVNYNCRELQVVGT